VRLHKILSALVWISLPGLAAGNADAQQSSVIVTLSTTQSSMSATSQPATLKALVTGVQSGSSLAVTWGCTSTDNNASCSGLAGNGQTSTPSGGVSVTTYTAPQV